MENKKSNPSAVKCSRYYCAVVVFFLQIEHGANIDARDISDATPLLFAAAEGLTEIIQVILDKGRQINIVEEEIKK